VPAPGAFTRRPGHLRCPSSSKLLKPFSAGDKVRQRQFQGRRELDEVPIARIPQPALDLADVGPVHPGKIGQPLLREAIDFTAPCPYCFAKSL
jgi:hypothetical protein